MAATLMGEGMDPDMAMLMAGAMTTAGGAINSTRMSAASMGSAKAPRGGC